ncbi:MAG TPA: phosphatidylserine decarboxylase family protein [Smithellaceae bacterium]|nr:phosphatidylserine decarboxylase family protein [Smithellaceae bacterium]
MPDKIKAPIAIEGLKITIPLAVLTILLFFAGWQIAGLILLAITVFMLFFFRDPDRAIPQGEGLVVSPADGKVVVIKDIHEKDYLQSKRKQISIFLSVFNVHVNRAPISGTIETVKYNPGKFHIAAVEKASLENEQTAMVIADGNRKILVKQIAGILARRIICYAKQGNTIEIGSRYGLICFGSRVDIFLPEDAEINVKLGDNVKGGRDIIAILK